ncbi:MAG: type II toxin-antitoxin system VapC family toxin [Spirochaetaceae bacterium]|nr:type II toxin-antitoxin system VapC family toxin [Spirochaetaceae bacterium]
MVIDSSALIAILLGEEEAQAMVQAISENGRRMISSVTALETSIVINARKGGDGERELELLLYKIQADIIPFTRDHYILALEAWKKYGKGRHPAGLNMGDCCSYSLAMSSGEPLLFKGEDFAQTDVNTFLS